MLLNRRPAIVLSIFAACVLAITPPVSAGCLCDWLFGRQPVYAATMPVTPVPTYNAAMPAYSAAMPVTPLPAQAAYQIPVATPTTQYAAQMPAYGAATPLPTGYAGQYSSLYGGTAAPAVAPVAAAPAVTAAPITSYYGTGNVYPPIQTTSGYTANYAPSYTAYQPVAAPSGGLVGGIRGFFGDLFGTNYRTSYYRAPVTYYRPLTTVDPVSGSTVTVQRPCTAYQYQVQRMPYVGLQPAAATPVGGCATTAPYAQAAPYVQPTYAQPAPLSSNGAVAPSSEGYVPQPTLPPAAFDPYGAQRTTVPTTPTPYVAPHTYTTPSSTGQPLTGRPSIAPTTSSTSGDYAPVAQPEIKSYRVPESDDNSATRYWQAPPTSGLPEPPSVYARPIPAPPATWSQPESAPTTEPSTGRTASRPAWGFKQISWNASADRSIQQAGYEQSAEAYEQSAEASDDRYRREPVESVRRQPATLAPPQRTHSGYDNSGWRAAR